MLSGYFCKLVMLLLSRKLSQIIGYIFEPESTVIEDLFNHLGENSISDLLARLIFYMVGDYKQEVLDVISQKQ